MLNIDELKFDEKGLIPAIVTDSESGDVLMLGYMNAESLRLTLEKQLVCFYSRSRNCLWVKGETSGNLLHLVSVTADCDSDALLVRAKPDGPTCHTGERSCFFKPVAGEVPQEAFSIDKLYGLITERKRELPEGSYTTYLFKKGLDKILKKIGEEATEVIIGAKNSREECIYELADLMYHSLVLMAETDITPSDIRSELAKRHVIDVKVKQERMI